MLLRKLTIKGFKSIEKPLELSFPEGIIGIYGNNESGKTSLLEAIYIALYGFPKGKASDRDSKINQISWGQKRTRLELEFLIGDEIFLIKRQFTEKEHKCKLFLFQDNDFKLVTNSITDINNEISRLIGMDRDSFAKLVYIRQKELDNISELEKRNREMMLNKIMGIDIFDKIVKRAMNDRKEVMEELKVIKQKFEILEKWKREREELMEKIDELTKTIKKREEEIKIKKQDLKIWNKKLQQLHWLKKSNEFEQKIEEIKEEIKEIKENIADLDKKIEHKKKLENQLAKLGNIEEKIEKLLILKRKEEKIEIKDSYKKEQEKNRTLYLNQIQSIEEFQNDFIEEYQDLRKSKDDLLKIQEEVVGLEKREKILEKELQEIMKIYKVKDIEEIEEKYAIISRQYPRILVVMIVSLCLSLAGLIMLFTAFDNSNNLQLITSILLLSVFTPLSLFIINRFHKINSQKNQYIKYLELKRVENNVKRELQGKKRIKKTILSNIGFFKEKELYNRIEEIEDKMVQKFKCKNFDELGGTLKQLKYELRTTKKNIKKLKEEISELSKECIEISRDIGSDIINLKQQIKEANQQKEKKDMIEGELTQLKKQIKELQEKDYPKKLKKREKEYSTINKKFQIHKDVDIEISNDMKYSEEEEKETDSKISELKSIKKRLEEDQIADKRELNLKEESCKELKEKLKDYEKVKKRKEELEKEQEVLSCLINEIKEICANLRNRIIPVAKAKINQILPRITEQRYTNLEIQEDLKFMVYNPDSGDNKPRELFSGGTQDQFLIALRLAFTESIINSRVTAEEFVLFMDECISSSDEQRKSQIFDILSESKKTFKQIFIVSHDDISNHVDYYLHFGLDSDSRTTILNKNW